MPDVDMKAGFLVTSDGRVLWSRAADSKRAMASITKIMTAILAIEHSGPDEEVVIPAVSAAAGESSAGLLRDERLTRHELLEALLIKSGNDAALATAAIIGSQKGGGERPDAAVAHFVQLMNDKAADLGLEQTHFANPHGLDAPNHYTSAKDIATMARYAMRLPEFREVVGERRVRFKSNLRTHTLENTNILLVSYKGCNGVKTGWTGKAGYCVVDSAKRRDLEVYAIVLGTNSDLTRFFEARDLMDFAFAHYRDQELAVGGTIVGNARVTNFPDRSVPLAVSEDTSATVFDLAGDIEQELELRATKAPVHKGQALGTVTYTQGGKLVAKVPLVATEAVAKPFFLVQWYYNLVKLFR
jgi:D-alanyl-D-alanine carboxypeptidase (penicillin-binding protein 5/6)